MRRGERVPLVHLSCLIDGIERWAQVRGSLEISGLGFLEGFVWSVAASLALGAAYQDARYLVHPTRRRIYEHLLRLPGDHFRSIAGCLRLTFGTGYYHLNVLLRAGWILANRIDGRSRYYPAGLRSEASVNHLYAQFWTYQDLRLRILLAVRRMGEARASAVARLLGISRQLATYHLRRLVEMGHLSRDGRVYKPSTIL